jgi:multisubunit Na+/H+ antiporter MnhB subunit
MTIFGTLGMKTLTDIIFLLAYGFLGLIASVCMYAIDLDVVGVLVLGTPLVCLMVLGVLLRLSKKRGSKSFVGLANTTGMDYRNLRWWEVLIVVLAIVLILNVMGQCIPMW